MDLYHINFTTWIMVHNSGKCVFVLISMLGRVEILVTLKITEGKRNLHAEYFHAEHFLQKSGQHLHCDLRKQSLPWLWKLVFRSSCRSAQLIVRLNLKTVGLMVLYILSYKHLKKPQTCTPLPWPGNSTIFSIKIVLFSLYLLSVLFEMSYN